MRKYFLLLVLVSTFLTPLAASAQLDSRCWTKKACDEARQLQLNGAPIKLEDGFVETAEATAACGATDFNGDKYGFCLPAGRTVTQIAFGGRREFLHLGEFIEYGYRYGIAIAGLLGVFMIIVAGVEWLTSGGNAERITSAKKRIGGALMGVFLAVMSYFILDAVNPYLTTLRMPQIWLINRQDTPATLCKDLQAGTKIALAKEEKEKIGDDELRSRYATAKEQGKFLGQSVTSTAACASEYFTEKGGIQTCRGTACPRRGNASEVCAPNITDPALHTCYPGNIAGLIYNADSLELALSEATFGVLGEQWAWPWIDKTGVLGDDQANSIDLVGVCNNGKKFDDYPTSTNFDENEQKKIITFLFSTNASVMLEQKIREECGALQELKGFALGFDFNESGDVTDEYHYIGSNAEADLGDTTHFTTSRRTSLPKESFISLKQLQEGFVMNINAGKIIDYD